MTEAQRHQAPIREVTVFRRGALVTRAFELPRAEAGYASAVRVDGLPLSLDDASLRVVVRGQGELPLAAGVRVGLATLGRDDVDDVPSDTALKEAALRERELELALEVATRSRDRLLALEPAGRPAGEEGKPPIEATLEARLALIGFRARELEQLDARIATQVTEHAAAVRHRRDLEEKLSRISSQKSAREGELRKFALIEMAHVEATATSALVEVAYVVPGARWAPAYAIYFDQSLARCRLAARAVVAQRSGEDWTGVRVQLSTAEPQSFVELPELSALRIGRRQAPPRPRGFRVAPEVDASLFADFDGARRRLGRPPAAEPTEEGSLTAVMRADELLVDDAEPTPVAERRARRELVADSLAPFAAAPPAQASGMVRQQALAEAAVTNIAMPLPPMAGSAMPRPESKSAAFDLAAPSPVGLPPPAKRGRMATLSFGGQVATAKRAAPPADAYDGPAEVPEAPAEAALLLDYGALRVPDYRVANRGKLIQKSALLLYVETSTFDFHAGLKALREASSTAEKIEALPSSYREVAPLHGFHHVFASGAPADIPSDAKYHTIGLAEAETTCTLTYVVVPRESSEAYRVVTIQNPIAAPLLEGPCDVYRGRDFFSTTHLRATPHGGAVELGLGVEQAIKVARNARYYEETSGLLRGSLELKHEVRIEIANHLATSARFEVRERLPHARENDDDVAVQLEETSPAWEPYRQDEAPLARSHAWRFELPAAEKKTLVVKYVVRIPSKYELAGGNRREA